MTKPVLLDLFAGAGGAAMGYHRAGFDVVGVDIRPQPRYPFKFIQADAMTFPLAGYDAIHASPPCQLFTPLNAMWNRSEHRDLLTPTRERLKATSRPYVIENVPGAPMSNYLMLCGSMFGLGSGDAELRRHRWFETHPEMWFTPPCGHNQRASTVWVYGHAGGTSNRAKARVIGVYGGHGRDRRRRDNTQEFSTERRKEAMGIEWMTGEELSQAIPPAYCEYIGRELMRILRVVGDGRKGGTTKADSEEPTPACPAKTH